MGQQVKTLVTKADNPRTHMVTRRNQLPLICPLTSSCPVYICLHMVGVQESRMGARERMKGFFKQGSKKRQ